MQIMELIDRVLPVLFLISLGFVLRRSGFLKQSGVDQIKKMVVHLALPAVLFSSFLHTDLKLAYLLILAVVFLLCLALWGTGQLLQRWVGRGHPYFPFLMTGFEYGQLGISLFGTVFGLENIGYIAVIALGHEIFIWFVFLAFLMRQRDGIRDLKTLIASFSTSPVIVAIVAGIALNILGLRSFIDVSPVTSAVMATLDALGDLSIPLILIVVGFGISLDHLNLKESLTVVLLRMAIAVPLAWLVDLIVFRQLLHLDRFFGLALFTLLILPPPFIIPLYMDDQQTNELRYINNTLMLHTLISIAVFVVYVVIFSPVSVW